MRGSGATELVTTERGVLGTFLLATRRSYSERGGRPSLPEARTAANKRMKLTSLAAAPGWQAEVPPRAPHGEVEGRTVSQLIRGVMRTHVALCSKR